MSRHVRQTLSTPGHSPELIDRRILRSPALSMSHASFSCTCSQPLSPHSTCYVNFCGSVAEHAVQRIRYKKNYKKIHNKLYNKSMKTETIRQLHNILQLVARLVVQQIYAEIEVMEFGLCSKASKRCASQRVTNSNVKNLYQNNNEE